MKRSVSSLIIVVVGLCVLTIIGASWGFWPFNGSAWTDDAFVQGDITTISPKIAGYVREIMVGDYQPVKMGDPLVKIDDQDFVALDAHAEAQQASAEAAAENNISLQAAQAAMIDVAKAKVASAQAAADRADSDYKRAASVIAKGAVSASALDTSKADRDQTQAALAEAQASLLVAQSQLEAVQAEGRRLVANINISKADKTTSKLNVGYTTISAPVDGVTGERSVRVGQYVRAGTQLMPLVPKQKFWLIANYKENQLKGIHLGDRARVTVDALDNGQLLGRVAAFAPASGSEFALVPADNATGNFTKIARRFGVRIEFDDNQPGLEQLRPGMSAEVRIRPSRHSDNTALAPATFDTVADRPNSRPKDPLATSSGPAAP